MQALVDRFRITGKAKVMLFDANVAQVGPLLARGVARAGLTGFVFAVAVAKVPFDTQTDERRV